MTKIGDIKIPTTPDEPISLPLWEGECGCGDNGKHLMAECRFCGEIWGMPAVEKAPPMPEGWEWRWYNSEILHLLDREHVVVAFVRLKGQPLHVTLADTDDIPSGHWAYLGWVITNAERVWAETGNVPEVK